MIRKMRVGDSAIIAVTFSQPASHPNAPISLVGSFNDWQPFVNQLVKRPDGTLTTTVHAYAGAHLVFRYLGNDGFWFDDLDAEWVDHEGGHIHA